MSVLFAPRVFCGPNLTIYDTNVVIVGQVATCTPGGLLVFVSSYFLLSKLYDRWATTGKMATWARPVFREPRGSDKKEMRVLMGEFRASVDSGKGAVLLSVFRGKMSEGIDFADSHGRAVIAVGLPYPSVKEITIQLKKDFK